MIHVTEHKEPQHNLGAQRFLNAKRLYLPLSQHTGKPAEPIVARGDVVKEGQLLAQATAFISAPIHAPRGGKIVSIDNGSHPLLKRCQSITLECTQEPQEYPFNPEAANFQKEKLRDIIKENGIVGLGGAAFPTSVKLNPPKKIDTLIINGCECEPYLATDNRLMVEHLESLFKGIEIICKIIEPQQIIFAVEKNKPQAIKSINLFLTLKRFRLVPIRLLTLKAAYPQGGEKQLIKAALNREVPPGGLPLDVGALVHNVATCFALYEAVYCNKPLIHRLVTFAGDSLRQAKNVWVAIGTTLQELVDQKVIEFKCAPQKIIAGGPMMGVTLDHLEYPILKGSGGFLFLKESVTCDEETACIRCARCVDVCPMNLLPLTYPRYVKKAEFEKLSAAHILDCMECGCCTYTCPAKIPLVHYIKQGKQSLPKK